MKRILPFVLIVAFLTNSMGYYFIYEINRSILRKEMRAVIEKGTSRYTVIQLTNLTGNNDFHRVDKHEILYKGNLYDVISESKSGETTTFFCIRDFKEESLLIGFKKICRNKQLISLDDNLIKIALPQNTSSDLQHSIFTIHKFFQYVVPLNSRVILPIYPPPKPT